MFELTGGRLCLDLVNTLDERPTNHPRERLPGYTDLIDWAVQAGEVGRREAAAMRASADRHPPSASRALARVVALRETLFAIFSAVACGGPIPADALAALNRGIEAAHRRLAHEHDRFVWKSDGEGTADLDRLLGPIVWSAVELMTSPDLARVRQCEGEGCDWLFLDTSKNRSRRWCDMAICGNRAKARRHYRKVATRPQSASSRS